MSESNFFFSFFALFISNNVFSQIFRLVTINMSASESEEIQVEAENIEKMKIKSHRKNLNTYS